MIQETVQWQENYSAPPEPLHNFKSFQFSVKKSRNPFGHRRKWFLDPPRQYTEIKPSLLRALLSPFSRVCQSLASTAIFSENICKERCSLHSLTVWDRKRNYDKHWRVGFFLWLSTMSFRHLLDKIKVHMLGLPASSNYGNASNLCKCWFHRPQLLASTKWIYHPEYATLACRLYWAKDN